MAAVEWILYLLTAYALAGVLFGVAFLTAGIARVDHGAAGSGVGFRLLILPGVAALWPLLLLRWIGASR
ncbi:MAG: hypothetical protein ABJF23_22920 [Bryobacteraceae bacterium]